MRIAVKLIIIVCVVTILRLVSSCCNCEEKTFSFNYESLQIGNIDNSGKWSRPSTNNKMPRAGVAFEIQIIGSEPTASLKSKFHFNGFNSLSAQTCNCNDRFTSNQQITEIHIRTLKELNSDYCCNDEVTPLFLANTCIQCDDIGNFYITINELISRINPESFYDESLNKFLLYLTVPVENNEAQFEIEVKLSDGKLLKAQTALIEITE